MRRAAFLLIAMAIAGCRGGKSEDPPVHLFGDMDWQPKYQWGEASPLFEDGRAMRPLVDGVIPLGHLNEDDGYYRGKLASGEYVARVTDLKMGDKSIEVDEKLIRRGEDRFNIYCAPCHDQSGGGRGMVVQRGYPPPVDLSSDRVRNEMRDGQIFETITNGIRNMPAYRKQIPVADRWAIVTWVRVLGRSQHASKEDVPADKQGAIEPEGAAK
jgi:mono/diheme cytochrome c family protein